MVHTWGEDGSGRGIVVATSRHSRHLDPDEARDRLLAEAVTDVIGRVDTLDPWRPLLHHMVECRWHSITTAEIVDGTHDCAGVGECQPGGWCSEGHGRAWVDVLDVANNRVYDLEEEIPR